MTAKNIPTEVVHIILEYDGRLKYEKGKYILNLNQSMFDSIHYCLKHKKIVSETFPFYSKYVKHIHMNKLTNDIELFFKGDETEYSEDSGYFLNIPISKCPYIISGNQKNRQLTWIKQKI